MASITQIEQSVTDLAVRMADEIDKLRDEMAAAGLGGSVSWDVLVDVPLTFTPSAHTQAASTITDFDAAVDARIALVPPGTPAWGDVTGKPTEFPPEAHTHVVADITDYVSATNALIAAAGAGTGNVFGPGAVTDSHIVLFDGTSGNAIKSAGAGFSANGLTLVGQTFANMRTSLGLVIGTDVQAWGSKLDAVAAMTWAADKGLRTSNGTTITTYDLTAFGRSLVDDADASAARATLDLYESYTVAVSDESTALATGASKVSFRAPYACTHVAIPRSSINTAHTAGLVTADVNINGVSMLSTKLSIDANEKTSKTAATPAAMSTSAWDDDDEITIDLDATGSAGTPKGHKVTFYLRRA